MDILSRAQLEVLYKLFFAESKKTMVLQEFQDALSALLGLGEEESNRMFLKIDADNDGAVSWEEFSSHVIALGHSKRHDNVSTTTSVKILEENINRGLDKSVEHSMTIEVATYIAPNQWRPDVEKYVTCTRDGAVKLWSGSNGHPLKTNITLQGPSAYVLAIAPLCKYNIVAVSSNDHKIRFFSYEPRLRLDLEYDCGNCQAMSMTCFAVEEKSTDRKENKSWMLTSYLVWGDDCGSLHFVLEDCLMELRSATAAPSVDATRVQKMDPEKQFARSLFNGWVTKIEFFTGFSSTGILAVCSNDGTIATLGPDSWQVLTKFQGHKYAVKSFAWCKQYKCVASSGLDRDILLWDVASGHKTGRMRGHQAPVLHMIYYEKQDNLFSLDQRYFLNVWDVSKQALIAKINTDEGDPFVDYHGLRAGCVLINQRRGHVTLCARRPYVWTIRALDNVEDDVSMSFHSHPLIAVMYSSALHQLVSLDNSGLVLVLEFHDGKTCFRFNITSLNMESKESEITCAILNVEHRELLVGFANGRISGYNFNNGFLTNHYITGSNGPILAMQVSEKGDKRGSMIFASGLDGCVWMWISAVSERPSEILFEKRFQLPIDRPDYDIDIVSIVYHKSGILATGRQDGRVLLWNPVDGRLRRELVDDLFTKIDADRSGSITYGEMNEYLRDENFNTDAIGSIFKRIDKDQSGDISKDEFRSALSKEGTLFIDPLTGRGVAKKGQQVEFLKFFQSEELLLASASANGTIAIFNAETGSFFRFLQLAEQRRTDMVTCFALIDDESLLVTGDSVGTVKLYDTSELPSRVLNSQPCLLLHSWKAHYEAVMMVSAVSNANVVVSCNAGHEPQIYLWSYAGELVGVIGDRHTRKWAIPVQPMKPVLEHFRRSAREKLQDAAALKENEERVLRQVRSKFRNGRRIANMRSAAYTVLNKNFFDREAAREAQLDVRVKRMKLFFKLQQHHFADSMDLIEKFEAHMKHIWRKEIEEEEMRKNAQTTERNEADGSSPELDLKRSKYLDGRSSRTPGDSKQERQTPPVPALHLPALAPRFGPTSVNTARDASIGVSHTGVTAVGSVTSRDFGWHNIAVQNLGSVTQDAIRQDKNRTNNPKSIFTRAKKDQASAEPHEDSTVTIPYIQKPGTERRIRLENELDALTTRQPGVGVTTGLVVQVAAHVKSDTSAPQSALRRVSAFSQASAGPSPRITPQVKHSGANGKDSSSPIPMSGARPLPSNAGSQDQHQEPNLSAAVRTLFLSGPIAQTRVPSTFTPAAPSTLQQHAPPTNPGGQPVPPPSNRKVESDKPKGRIWQSKLPSSQANGGGYLGAGPEAAAKAASAANEMRVIVEQRLWEWSTQSRWRSRLYTVQAGAVFAVDLDRPKAQQVRLGGFSQRTAVRVLSGPYQGRRNCLSLEMDEGMLSDGVDTRVVVLSADDEQDLLRFVRALDAEVERARRVVRDVEMIRLTETASIRQAQTALDKIMRIEKP